MNDATKASGGQNYGSAFVDILRENPQEIGRGLIPSITRIDLNEIREGILVIARSFIVKDGKWVEITRIKRGTARKKRRHG